MFAVAFTAWGSPVTWAEILAFVLSLAMVLANMRVHVVAWPLAIASSALYAGVFADGRLYGQAALQLLFIALAAWGWWQWLRGRGDDGAALQVRRLPARARWLGAGFTLLAWLALGTLLQRATDSAAPFLDALPTAGSVTGQLLLGRKYLENWPVWAVVNVVSVALFASQGLVLTAILYGLFALLSFAGWRQCQRLAPPEPAHG